MDGIRKLGLLISALSLLSALFCFLLPRTGLEEAVRAAAGLFFTGTLIFAVMQAEITIKPDFSRLSELRRSRTESFARSQTLSLAGNALSDRLYGELRKEGIAAEKVELSLHILPGESIEINRLTVTVPAEDAVEAGRYLKERCGIFPELVITEEEG